MATACKTYGPLMVSTAVFISAVGTGLWYVSGSKGVKAQNQAEINAAAAERRWAFTAGTGDFSEALGFADGILTNWAQAYTDAYVCVTGNLPPWVTQSNVWWFSAYSVQTSSPYYAEIWDYSDGTDAKLRYMQLYDVATGASNSHRWLLYNTGSTNTLGDYQSARPEIGTLTNIYGADACTAVMRQWYTNVACGVETNWITGGMINAGIDWDTAYWGFGGARDLAVLADGRGAEYVKDDEGFWFDKVHWTATPCGAWTSGTLIASVAGGFATNFDYGGEQIDLSGDAHTQRWWRLAYSLHASTQDMQTADTRHTWTGIVWEASLTRTNSPLATPLFYHDTAVYDAGQWVGETAACASPETNGWWRDRLIGTNGYRIWCERWDATNQLCGYNKGLALTNLWQAKALLEAMTTTVAVVPAYLAAATNIDLLTYGYATNGLAGSWVTNEQFAGEDHAAIWAGMLAAEWEMTGSNRYESVAAWYAPNGAFFSDAEAELTCSDREDEWPVGYFTWYQAYSGTTQARLARWRGVTLPYPSAQAMATGLVARVRIFAVWHNCVYEPSVELGRIDPAIPDWDSGAWDAFTGDLTGYAVQTNGFAYVGAQQAGESWSMSDAAGKTDTGRYGSHMGALERVGAGAVYGEYPAKRYAASLLGVWEAPTAAPVFDLDTTSSTAAGFTERYAMCWRYDGYADAPDPEHPEYAYSAWDEEHNSGSLSKLDLVAFIVVCDWHWKHLAAGSPYDPAAEGETNTPAWAQ